MAMWSWKLSYPSFFCPEKFIFPPPPEILFALPSWGSVWDAVTSNPITSVPNRFLGCTTLHETNSLPLKIHLPKRKVVFQATIFRCICWKKNQEGYITSCHWRIWSALTWYENDSITPLPQTLQHTGVFILQKVSHLGLSGQWSSKRGNMGNKCRSLWEKVWKYL